MLRFARNDGKRSFAIPRRDAPELCVSSHPPENKRVQGKPDARCTRGLVCKMHKENAHEHTGQRRHFGIPCAMALRLMPRSPRRRIPFATVIGGLTALPGPVGPAKTSADLAPATGARTTRFCRTQPPVFAKRLRRALAPSSCVKDIAHGITRPAIPSRADAAASTASRPNVRDDGQRPSSRAGMGRASTGDLPDSESEIFLQTGLDRKN